MGSIPSFWAFTTVCLIGVQGQNLGTINNSNSQEIQCVPNLTAGNYCRPVPSTSTSTIQPLQTSPSSAQYNSPQAQNLSQNYNVLYPSGASSQATLISTSTISQKINNSDPTTSLVNSMAMSILNASTPSNTNLPLLNASPSSNLTDVSTANNTLIGNTFSVTQIAPVTLQDPNEFTVNGQTSPASNNSGTTSNQTSPNLPANTVQAPTTSIVPIMNLNGDTNNPIMIAGITSTYLKPQDFANYINYTGSLNNNQGNQVSAESSNSTPPVVSVVSPIADNGLALGLGFMSTSLKNRPAMDINTYSTVKSLTPTANSRRSSLRQ